MSKNEKCAWEKYDEQGIRTLCPYAKQKENV